MPGETSGRHTPAGDDCPASAARRQLALAHGIISTRDGREAGELYTQLQHGELPDERKSCHRTAG
jgi:hypothetical protein